MVYISHIRGYHWSYSEEGTGRGRSPSRPLLAVPNVTDHPSTDSVPITVVMYNGPLLCSFNVAIKGLIDTAWTDCCWLFVCCLQTAEYSWHGVIKTLWWYSVFLATKSLGVIFKSTFSFVDLVDYIIKICSQRVYLLKQLWDQGLPLQKSHIVFQAIVISRLMYALPAWGPLLNVELVHKIVAF